MATSSLYKTFSLKTKEETNVFMKKFEESLRNPSTIKKSSVNTATLDDTDKLVEALKKKYGNKIIK